MLANLAASPDCERAYGIKPMTSLQTPLPKPLLGSNLDMAFLGGIEITEIPWGYNDMGAIQIRGCSYLAVDKGAAIDGIDYNMCFYLCATESPAAALRLKDEIAPLATRYAHDLDINADFAILGQMADTETICAYVSIKKRSVIVLNVAAGKAVLHAAVDTLGSDPLMLHNENNHYRVLEPTEF